MGKILTVHGTFAHLDVPTDESESSTAFWWRADSAFMGELTSLLRGADGKAHVEAEAFTWSGDNSVQARRAAGQDLYRKLLEFEEHGAPYCIVAHSHGGSVVSAALLQAAAKGKKLPGLKRWMTIGTPFIELQREPFLFMRLSFLLKAAYVAMFMLFLMFISATIGRYFGGTAELDSAREVSGVLIGATMTALPGLIFLLVVFLRERQKFHYTRPSVVKRGREFFADRWLAMTHEDDEVVRGLTTIKALQMPIFHKNFAVPALTYAAVFMLPTLYVVAILSPSFMVGFVEKLRTSVYQLDVIEEQVGNYRSARRKLRGYKRELRAARRRVEEPRRSAQDRLDAEKAVKERRAAMQQERERLRNNFPDSEKLSAALRFQNRFLKRKRETCNNGKLCGGGEDIALNARVLMHVAVDSATLFNSTVRRGFWGQIYKLLVPTIVVPIVFTVIAILWVLIVRMLARGFSNVVSRWLDRLTWKEIRRSAVGNDTEDEIATGSAPHPPWIDNAPRYLPLVVSSEITQCSNDATLRSITKFRDAISELAFSEGNSTAANKLLAYVNWSELIHTSYFCVPGFTRLVAFAVTETDGFKPGGDLDDPEARKLMAEWLSELEGKSSISA